MADEQTTSAVAEYSANSGAKRLVLEEDTSPGLVKLPGQSFVRVYPSAAKAVVTPVMGGSRKIATNITIDVIDYVSFENSSSSSLKYTPLDGVSIEDERFFQSEPAVAYDEASNSIVLDINAFGICKVSYTAAYDRYLVTHGDSPCKRAETQSEGDEEPTAGVLSYDPAFLVAVATGWETGSITVQGPPCEGRRGYGDTIQFNRYEPVGLKLEQDVKYPSGFYEESFNASKTPDGFTIYQQVSRNSLGQSVQLYAGCKIRVYPREAVTLLGINCAVSAASVGQGTRLVGQALTFSGSQSVGLEYPITSSTISVSGQTNAIDLFNESVNVAFAKPGDEVNEVKWEDSNTYEITEGVREVRADEIVCVTALGNNTIPVFTFCDVQYSSDYYLYDVLFNWDENAQWYGKAVVLAYTADGRRGSIEITPPAKGGVP